MVYADQIRTLVDRLGQEVYDFVGDLLLIGHSRGAVQACMAAEYLRTFTLRCDKKVTRYANISVVSFGAPMFPIPHSVCQYVTLVEMTTDPCPGWSAVGVIVRLPASAVSAFPQYSRWKVKWNTKQIMAERALSSAQCHYMAFYVSVIANYAPSYVSP